MQRILIIEDEQDLASLVAFNLQGEGYAVTVCHDGREGLESALEAPPDLIILDLMLPTILGTEVCKRLKNKTSTADVPVIMLTARGEEIDRVVGFEVGADDYVVKPFSVRELLLRVRALLRRTGAPVSGETVVRIGDLAIDTDRHQVTVANEPVILTTTEFKLLHILAERRGRLQSRDTLLKDVWGYAYVGDTRTVDTHVTRLRTKLGPVGDMIKTVRGFGYKMEEA
ncbi:response regulator [Geobacter argillaceus]|uniref:Phosphate regulon transcriptional regulatory protein PhoB n=1 Tax=Geobacter argillaceus TaxID=345631 RepID=A0A562WS56_9BACT|nr:response regulator transcription factor [Geobacter argillaceus]TWJ32587.1 two component transcriptional regulator, winged helix family [Geobacter argillaceus]